MPVHYSHLKKMALSAAHYQASVNDLFEATRAMRIGTIVHHLVLGPHTARKLVRFDGKDRRGKEWEKCVADNPYAELVTLPEWLDAEPIAAAVLADPVAADLLKGTRREVALSWNDAGVECATDGIDFVGNGYIGDLKTTTCTEPRAFSRHAVKLLYHCQAAWMESGAKLNRIDTSKGVFLLGVEVTPPHAVTVLRVTPDILDLGRKSCTLWLEKYKSCCDANFWPAYTQSVLDLELPHWLGEDNDETSGD